MSQEKFIIKKSILIKPYKSIIALIEGAINSIPDIKIEHLASMVFFYGEDRFLGMSEEIEIDINKDGEIVFIKLVIAEGERRTVISGVDFSRSVIIQESDKEGLVIELQLEDNLDAAKDILTSYEEMLAESKDLQADVFVQGKYDLHNKCLSIVDERLHAILREMITPEASRIAIEYKSGHPLVQFDTGNAQEEWIDIAAENQPHQVLTLVWDVEQGVINHNYASMFGNESHKTIISSDERGLLKSICGAIDNGDRGIIPVYVIDFSRNILQITASAQSVGLPQQMRYDLLSKVGRDFWRDFQEHLISCIEELSQ